MGLCWMGGGGGGVGGGGGGGAGRERKKREQGESLYAIKDSQNPAMNHILPRKRQRFKKILT